jgi:hypothetical protein
MRVDYTIRGAFHRSRTIAPRRSFERPAPVFADTAALPPRYRLSMPFHPPGAFRIRVGRAPVHAARCQRDSRFSGPRRRSPTSATETTRGHTLRAFDPRTRVRLSPRCSPAPTDAGCVGLAMRCRIRKPASHDLHATACARRVPLAWTGQIADRSARVKASCALLDDVARALLVAPRAPGSPARVGARDGSPLVFSRQPRSTSDTTPRRAIPLGRSRCLLP